MGALAETLLNDPRYKAIIGRLLAARKSAGLNQRELAERLGQPQSFITRVETFERRLDIIRMIEWVRALDLDERKFMIDVLGDVPATKRKKR